MAASTLLAIAAAGEITLRLMGVGNFPLYRRDPFLDYIPRPNQAGAFRNTRHWVFNDRSMGTARPYRPRRDDILLVGDSVVMGNNGTDQSERLGPQLELRTGCRVWPIAASSWSLSTELRLLERYPDLLRPGTIVFLSNSADMIPASRWYAQWVQPTHRPWSVLAYAVHKTVMGRVAPPPDGPPGREEWPERLSRLLKAYDGRIVWALFPWQQELHRPVAPLRLLEAELPAGVERFRIDADPRWTGSAYLEGYHPSPAGNVLLADILARRLPHCSKPGG